MSPTIETTEYVLTRRDGGEGRRLLVVESTLLRTRRGELVDLLDDAVAGGASVGFLWPVDRPGLERYWDDVAADIDRGERVLLAVERAGRIVGAVQLAPCMKAKPC